MKLKDINGLSNKNYSDPKSSVHWDFAEWGLSHPKFKYLPELQDHVFEMMHNLPDNIKEFFLNRYNKENVSTLLMLSPEETIQLEIELHNYIDTGALP